MAELLNRQVDAHVRHLVAGSGYVMGEFSCPPDSDRWNELNWSGERPLVVIGAVGKTAVRISVDGTSYVSTANEALIYDADVEYRRQLVSDGGDSAIFLALDPSLYGESGHAANPSRRPAIRQRRCDPQTFALGQSILAELRRSVPDLLAVDEWTLTIVDRLAQPARPELGAGYRARTTHHAAINEVKTMLAGEADRRWTLNELGAAAHYSPYFLSRLFRRLTGSTIAAYRRQLRLCESLDALGPGADLSAIAAEFGFSSHSHYTREFHAAFGCTPSQARATGLPQATLPTQRRR